ncbi:hypothetical protein ABH909_004047 [Pseudomonas sp. BS3782 TE3695]|uniref:hypothetical protein n=1 Tax=Pseudomonas sp. BS3782 TE3695 TaxID=3349323 RepID=UPI003D249D7D
MAEKMRKRSRNDAIESVRHRNDKALNNQGFVGTNMAEAMSAILTYFEFYCRLAVY